ncbi:MAG: RdgB/HAM1 family non-canonical purine NTP pyrophosphatase [Verrucomicrobia bacterium]|nr:RdgB/HAM1 family non-canonical purine NTP pyrophosphatase [Verrucomicrobiota bacterium]
MRLHLASANAHKVAEFSALAEEAGLPVEIVSARAVGGMPPVVEDTGTFAGNAAKKARALHARLPEGSWVLADDSGLSVAALGGQPGVESAYYAGPQGDGAANLRKLVRAMHGVPAGKRSAHFTCVLVLIDGRGHELVFEGRCDGHLRDDPVGGGGFGYDPLFVPNGYTQTFAELSEAEKNGISHRGRAWARLVEWWRRHGPSA